MEKLSQHIPKNYDIVTSDGSAHVVSMQVLDLKGKQRLITNKGNAPYGTWFTLCYRCFKG
jgi:hypothetical protein